MPSADYFDLIADLTGGADIAADREARALELAVAAISMDAPRPLAWVRVSEDGRTVPLPPDWTDGVSVIEAITVAADGDVPLEIQQCCWRVADSADGRVIRLASAASPGAAFDIAYTAGHVVNDDDGVDTIPVVHRGAVAAFAAAVLLDGMAAAHAADLPPVAGAQALPGSGDSPSRAYAARAKDLRRQYYAALGIDPDERAKRRTSNPGFAAAEVSISVNRPEGGRIFRRGPGLTRGA